MTTQKIDKALVRKVAGLANLELSEADVAYYETQLEKILTYVAQLASLPETLGEGWRPDTERPATPERPDEVVPPLPPEAALANAPDEDGTAFRVPRILD